MSTFCLRNKCYSVFFLLFYSKYSQFLYIPQSNFSQCTFSWFTQYHLNSLLSTVYKFVTWNKDKVQKFVYSVRVEIIIIIVVASSHQWFSTSLANNKMVILTNACFAFLALETDRRHLLSCLRVTYTKNILNTSFASSPLASPWVWEQVFISSATSSSCSDYSPSTSSSRSNITLIDIPVFILSISLKHQDIFTIWFTFN